MFTTVKTRVRSTIDIYHIAKLLVAEAKADAKYESMIVESRAKIGEYKPVPFVPVVIA